MAAFQIFTSLRFDPLLAESPAPSHAGWNADNATSPVYMLDLHRDRLLRAATYFAWEPVITFLSGKEGLTRLHDIILAAVGESSEPLRVRIQFDAEANPVVTTNPERPVQMPFLFPDTLSLPPSAEERNPEASFSVLVDVSQTSRSVFTHYKTTQRDMYDLARLRGGITATPGPLREILLVNESDGSVMEGSTTTPYFWRGGKWVTPPVFKGYVKDIENRADSGGQDGTTRRWALERGYAAEEVVLASSLVDGEPIWLSNGVKGFVQGYIELVKKTKDEEV